MKCPKCHIKIKDNDAFCPECGSKIETVPRTGEKSDFLTIFVIILVVLVVIGISLFFIFNEKPSQSTISVSNSSSQTNPTGNTGLVSNSSGQKIADITENNVVENPTNNTPISEYTPSNLKNISLPQLKSSIAAPFDRVVANSEDWRDVYSALLYAGILGKQPGMFLTDSNQASMSYDIPKNVSGILVITSQSKPVVNGYNTKLTTSGYSNVNELRLDNINLNLANILVKQNNVKRFILVDDTYGYDAISSVSYAVADQYYVLFVNTENIDVVDAFLSSVNPQKIILLGKFNYDIKNQLMKYSVEEVGNENKFNNNIEMIKKYQNIKHNTQVLITDGTFIEPSIISGQDPVIFVSATTVPYQIIEYIKQSEFQVGVLIGNELINSANVLRNETGMSIFVKFAQGSRTPEGPIPTVEDLDKIFITP